MRWYSVKKSILAIGLILSILFCTFSFFQYLSDDMPFGHGIGVVLSKSMSPAYRKFDIVLYKEDCTNLSVGDVVLYKNSSGETVMHRIIEIQTVSEDEREIQTKGDNNVAPDTKIQADDVIAVSCIRIRSYYIIAVIVFYVIICLLPDGRKKKPIERAKYTIEFLEE